MIDVTHYNEDYMVNDIPVSPNRDPVSYTGQEAVDRQFNQPIVQKEVLTTKSKDTIGTGSLEKEQISSSGYDEKQPPLVSPQVLDLTHKQTLALGQNFILGDDFLQASQQLATTSGGSANAVVLQEFLKAVGTALAELRQALKEGESGKGVKSRELMRWLTILDNLRPNPSELAGMAALRDELQAFKKQSGNGPIYLGDRPDLAYRLFRAGVKFREGNGTESEAIKEKIASGSAPYDNPVYANMALQLPEGWESLNLNSSDLNQLLADLDQQIGVTAMKVAVKSGMEGEGLLLVAGMAASLMSPLAQSQPQLADQLILQMQLQSLKAGAKDGQVKLVDHPEIMLQLKQQGIIPSSINSELAGTAKELADQHTPPYDNPVYAQMAQELPPGWEDLSLNDLNKSIQQLNDQMLSQAQQASTQLPPSGGVYNFIEINNQLMMIKEIANLAESSMNPHQNFFRTFGFDSSDQLLQKIMKQLDIPGPFQSALEDIMLTLMLTTSLADTVGQQAGLDFLRGNSLSRKIRNLMQSRLPDLLTERLAERYQISADDQHILKQSLIGFSIAYSLSLAGSRPLLQQALNSLSKIDDLGSPAGIAQILLDESVGEEEETDHVIDQTIQRLREQFEGKYSIENLDLLRALIKVMLKLLAQISAVSVDGSNQSSGGDFLLPIQG